jgi:transcriptional regulator with XRE-family HTH domain
MMVIQGCLDSPAGRRIESLERDLGMNDETLAAVLGLDTRNLQRWRQGVLEPSEGTKEMLEHLERLRDELFATFRPPEALLWLRTANPKLGDRTPAEAIAARQLVKVELAIDAFNNAYV